MKRYGILVIPFILFSVIPVWGQPFTPFKVEKIPGTYYYTPSASSKEFAVFGYVSKITPTPSEIEAEKRRISAIIDESVRTNYGSWQNMDRAFKKEGHKTLDEIEAKAPSWLRYLLPPTLIKETVPLFIKGALLYAKAHPEAMREPVGNVGETGILVVDKGGSVSKIPLGINAPVVSISISKNARLAAVLTDMGVEDEKGRLHPLGEISIIDLDIKKRVRSWIFANIAQRVAFTPLPNVIGFDCYKDMKDLSKRQLCFLNLKDGNLLKYRFDFCAGGSGDIFGKTIHYDGFIFHPREPVVALYNGKAQYEIWKISTKERIFRVRSGHPFVFASVHPWAFTSLGQLWDYRSGRLLHRVDLPQKASFLQQAIFSSKDQRLFCYDLGRLRCVDIDTRTGRVKNIRTSAKRGGLFFLLPEERYLASFVPNGGLVSYKGRYLRRQRLCLRILRSKDLAWMQDICMANKSTVLDGAAAGNIVAVSDFESLHLFVGPDRPLPQEHPSSTNQNLSVLEQIAANPQAFAGKIIEIDGWAWGWMSRPPSEVSMKNLAFAKGNYGSRNHGTFTDGRIWILYPVPVNFSGPLHVKAKVEITPFGWQLIPVR